MLRPLALLGALLCGCAAPPAGASIPGETLLPLKGGRVFTFLSAKKHLESITVEQKRDRYYSLDFTAPERMLWLLSREPEGLVLRVMALGHGALPLDPPLLFVPATVTEGVAWSSTARLKYPKEFEVDPEQVPDMKFTLAGSAESTSIAIGGRTYETRVLELRISGKGPPVVDNRVFARMWLAPGTGIVKSELGMKSPTSQDPAEILELHDVKDKE